MKTRFLTIVMLFCLGFVFSQNSQDEMEVRKINQAFDEAIKNADVAFYEKILASDYVSYAPDGTVKDRNQVLEEVKKQKSSPTYRISDIASKDVKVKMAGDLAIVTAAWDATSHNLDDKEPHKDQGHYMSIYEKRDGQWKLITEMVSEKPHTPEELQPLLEKASNQYDEAIKKGDKEAFAKLLADDYSSTNPQGRVGNRAEDIDMMFGPDLKLETISTEDKKFRVYRNSAVETGKYSVTGTHKGKKFSETGRYTSTWIFKDGKWQMVADHTSLIEPEK